MLEKFWPKAGNHIAALASKRIRQSAQQPNKWPPRCWESDPRASTSSTYLATILKLSSSSKQAAGLPNRHLVLPVQHLATNKLQAHPQVVDHEQLSRPTLKRLFFREERLPLRKVQQWLWHNKQPKQQPTTFEARNDKAKPQYWYK
jgi:hypothetical protein